MEHENEQQELNEELARALKGLTEAVVKETLAVREKEEPEVEPAEPGWEPVSPFPVSLVEVLLFHGLRALEHLVQRVVTAIIR